MPGPSSDYFGLVAGVLAGACWAAYIALNRVVGARLPGLQGPAAALVDEVPTQHQATELAGV